MSERWSFRFSRHAKTGDVVELWARVTGAGVVGDARSEVREGQAAFRIPFDELKRARAGAIIVENGRGRIIDQ